jgi:hypothetical protein
MWNSSNKSDKFTDLAIIENLSELILCLKTFMLMIEGLEVLVKNIKTP